jgi:predicted transcriptional regulator
MEKKNVTMALSSDARSRLEILSRTLNVSKTSVAELALKDFARAHNIRLFEEIGGYR